ncbi:MAG: aminotransferase class I/II-fold pyridoxal phosphate-dependent enzyme, partial [Chitinophagales bacterium]
VSLRPEMRDYTIYIDGLSKAFASTGVRVGWAFGPTHVIHKMRSILSHIGAWSPKPEQVAAAAFLKMDDAVERYLTAFRNNIYTRLQGFYTGFQALRAQGFKVDCIAPQSAIYLTVRCDLRGMTTADGMHIQTMADVADYLLQEAKIALVPFYAFGSDKESPWFRLSIGTCKVEDVEESMRSLQNALQKLH